MLKNLLGLILLLFWSAGGVAQTCSSDWEILNPQINLGTLNAVTYGNNQFVAVGAAGRVGRSSDGVNWTKARTGAGGDLSDVVWGNGRYVAVSYNGSIVSSTDGENWTENSPPSADGKKLYAIAWSGTRFVAVGIQWKDGQNKLVIADSQNGMEWNFQASPLSDNGTGPADIAWDGSQFIVVSGVSRDNRSMGLLLVSQDGQNWEVRYLEEVYNLISVTVGGTRRIIKGQNSFMGSGFLYSDDGRAWKNSDVREDFRALTWNGSRFLASRWDNRILASTDGLAWEHVYTAIGGVSGFATGGGKTVAVGGYGQSVVYTSADGLAWDSPLSVSGGDLHDVIWNGQNYLAVGFASGDASPPILTSPDSAAWSLQKQGLENERGVLRAVASGNGRHVAAGDNGLAMFSSDGQKWERIQDQIVNRYERFYQDALWDGNQFILAGTEWPWNPDSKVVLLTSPDGKTWTQVDTRVNGYLVKMINAGGQLVGVGGYIDNNDGWRPKAMVLTSPNGRAWTFQPIDLPGTLYGVTWNNNQFVAVGSKNCWWHFCSGETGMSILTSPNALDWTQQSPGIASVSYQILNKVAWGNNEFVTVGDKGLILASPDGVNWQLRHSGTSQALLGLEWDGNRFISTGLNGAIVRSKCTDTAPAQPGQYVADKLWIRAVIQTEEKGPVEARWKLDGQDTTARGDKVIWGHFYADPQDVDWGNVDNPDLFVKIWFDQAGRIDVNYFHVSVPDIHVYTAYDGNPDKPQVYGTATMGKRYIRHYFQDGQSGGEEIATDLGSPAEVPGGEGKPAGADVINGLRIGSRFHTESAGVIDGKWRLGGSSKTSRGDEVAWGLFHADPADVNWGSPDNPDVFVKVWFDFSGRIDVNYFHVSVPSIGVHSDYPSDGTYDKANMISLSQRYVRHEFQKK